MPASKITITIEKTTLTRLDRLVRERIFPNRSKLTLECEKIDPREEIILAEEGFASEKGQWPEY